MEIPLANPVPSPEAWEQQMRAASPRHALHLRQLAFAELVDDVPEHRNAWAALTGISERLLRERGIAFGVRRRPRTQKAAKMQPVSSSCGN
jgi:hypothetical protein